MWGQAEKTSPRPQQSQGDSRLCATGSKRQKCGFVLVSYVGFHGAMAIETQIFHCNLTLILHTLDDFN